MMQPSSSWGVVLATASLALGAAHCGSSVIGGSSEISTSSSTSTGSSSSSSSTGSDGAGGASTTSSSSTGTSTSSTSTSTSTSSTSTGTSTSSSSSSSSGGELCGAPGPGLPMTACTPADPSCQAASSVCVPLVNNLPLPNPGLRMSHIAFKKPTVFTAGIVGQVLANAVIPARPACNLAGSGTFSWLFQFDLAAGTVKTGGAKPPQNPAAGYSFVNEISGGLAIAPLTLAAPIDAGCAFGTAKGDVVMPIYVDAQASSAVLLPLHNLQIAMGQLSSDHGCIGALNVQGLDPADNCLPTGNTPNFIDAAQLSAFIPLEEADKVVITSLNQTLCVLLSGDPGAYGNGAMPVNKCKRDASMNIVFKGDWCAATDAAASAMCADSMRVSASFAASAVKIN